MADAGVVVAVGNKAEEVRVKATFEGGVDGGSIQGEIVD